MRKAFVRCGALLPSAILCALVAFIALTDVPSALAQAAGGSKKSAPAALQPAKLEFQVSIRGAGWMGWTEGGMMSGMLGRGLKIDALQVRFAEGSNTLGGGVWYNVCTADSKWQSWTRNGEASGKQDQSDVQAIALRLYNMPNMGIEYRVHITGGDWLAWVGNGEVAGIIGQGKTLDAVEIRMQTGAPPEASLNGDAPPPLPTAAPAQTTAQTATTKTNGSQTATQSDAPQTQASSGKKTSSSAQDNSQALPARVESFTIQEPPPQAQAAQPRTQQQSTTQQQNQTSGNQPDWAGVANTAGQVAGQALGGMNTGGVNTGAQQGNFNNQSQQGNVGQGNFNQGNFNQGNLSQTPPPNTQNWSQWTNQPMQRNRSGNFANAAAPVFVPLSSRRVALAANNGNFVSVSNDPRAGVVFAATRRAIGESETFELAFVGEHRVAFRTLNGRYLGVQDAGSGTARLAPLNDIIGQNEVFEMLNAPQDRVAFRAANGQLLSVESFSSARLFLKGGLIGQWEAFEIALPDGTPLLSEQPTNNFWQTQSQGTRTVVVDQQGRPIDVSDRVLMLIANPSTQVSAVSGATSGAAPTSATPPATTTAAAPVGATASAPTSGVEPAKPVVPPSSYLTPLEMEIINELNFVRTKPNEYATVLEKHRSYYKGKTYTAPGQKALTTKEGVKALDELIMALKLSRPATELTPSKGLSDAAHDHIKNTGPAGRVGHVGSDKSNPNERAARYGKGIVNENLCYNRTSAREVVVRLLVDDGTADRGYRKNILNPTHKLVGVGFGAHKTQQAMCVQVFAADFDEK